MSLPSVTPLINNHEDPPKDHTAKGRKLRQTIIDQVNNEVNLLWGDYPSTELSTCRIHLQNVNGISARNNFSDAHDIGSAADEIGVNILGLSETNTDWKARNTQNDVRSILKRYWKYTKTSFSSSDHRFETDYQPGGTIMIIGQPWAGRATMGADDSTEATLLGKEN